MVTSGFFCEENFDPDKDIPDLNGQRIPSSADLNDYTQVYIVTGASTGIGCGIIVHLLQHNASRIVILNDSEEQAREAMADLQQYYHTSRIIWQQCNLGGLQQTDEVAKKLRTEEQRVDGLIPNAGVGVNKFALTELDNLDSHFEVNILSQLHIALVLLHTLKATAETTDRLSRVVFMSSRMHRFSPSSTAFASVEEINTDIGAAELYARSKFAQILITRELARCLDKGELGFAQSPSHRFVIVNTTHPGGVKNAAAGSVASGLWRNSWQGDHEDGQAVYEPAQSKHGRPGLFTAMGPVTVEGEGVHEQYIMPDKKFSEVSKKGPDDDGGETVRSQYWTVEGDG